MGSDGRASFLITIDTEGDDLWTPAGRRNTTTRNAAFLPRFQSLCEKYGFKPTYLTDYEMARSGEFVEFARDAAARGTGEVGMHLHALDSPPDFALTDDDCLHHPYLIEYPEHVLREKVAFLTDFVAETFGARPISHRAGRWALNDVYARALIDQGYLVDCSVVPHVSYRRQLGDPGGRGGTDYTHFPERAYFLDPQDISQPGDSAMLEVPMTVMPSANRPANWLRGRLAAGSFCRQALDRLSRPVRWLRPNGRNLRHLLGVIRRAVEQGRDYVEFMLHSSEFMPGGSPTFPAEADIERLYEHMDALFAEAARHFAGATLAEYRRRVAGPVP